MRPLDEAHMRKLTVNGVQLLDCIDPNPAFVTELANAGCITWPQREHILEIVHRRDCNDKLLEFLTRRSVADFNSFIRVLCMLSTLYSHVTAMISCSSSLDVEVWPTSTASSEFSPRNSRT